MIPMKGANSGTSMTLLNRMTPAPPMPMPMSATATGRPIASTDPKATMRMITAKARPMASELGSSNSAKMNPPSSTRRPSMSGTSSRTATRTSAASAKSTSSGNSTLA